MRSLLSSVVEPDVIGTLYTTLAIMDSVGSLVAGPVVASLFDLSMEMKGIWVGMPFLSSFILTCLVAALVLTVGSVTTRSKQPGTVTAGIDEEEAALLTPEE